MGCWCSTVLVVGIFLLVLKIFIKLKTGWNRSPTCLIGKTAIVTGANTGIGFYTAEDFAKRGARVILACRDKDKAEVARKLIAEATGNSNVFVKILDLASLTSIRQFAKDINSTEENLHILVNNAGILGVGQQTTRDGLDLLFQVNYFGPFLLTHLLIDLMKKSSWGRIVNVSSFASNWAQINPNELTSFPECKLPRTIHYSNSKLCLILFTNKLANKLQGTGIQANSLHPGFVHSELFRRFPGYHKPIFNLLGKMFLKSPEKGAQTSIFLAVSKDVNLISGEYFNNCKIEKMPKNGRDEWLAKKVWEKSEEYVKLAAEERLL